MYSTIEIALHYILTLCTIVYKPTTEESNYYLILFDIRKIRLKQLFIF